ncbi:MAG: hypothetical protein ACFFEF_08160 [Candidatus Thorarchaeota archaeon]
MSEADELKANGYLSEGMVAVSEIIRELGQIGIIPFDVRTGFDHESISSNLLWKPRMGISANTNSDCHHLFTIAAMSGWTAEYDLNGRGVVVHRSLEDAEDTIGAWALLLNAARIVISEIGASP